MKVKRGEKDHVQFLIGVYVQFCEEVYAKFSEGDSVSSCLITYIHAQHDFHRRLAQSNQSKTSITGPGGHAEASWREGTRAANRGAKGGRLQRLL